MKKNKLLSLLVSLVLGLLAALPLLKGDLAFLSFLLFAPSFTGCFV